MKLQIKNKSIKFDWFILVKLIKQYIYIYIYTYIYTYIYIKYKYIYIYI